MNHHYESINTEEPIDETQSILIIGNPRAGKRALLQALQKIQTDDKFTLQNAADLKPQQFTTALQHCDQILLAFNKHDLETLEKLAEMMPEIRKKAPNAQLTLVETYDDELGALWGIDRDPSFEGITMYVNIVENDIQKFLHNEFLQNVQCISVSAIENKNIQHLWDHIKTLSLQSLTQNDNYDSSSEYGEDARLMPLTDEESVLNRINRFTTEYNSASAQITHRLNHEQLAHINSLATILTAGVLSKDPVEFFARSTVEKTLNQHLRALHYASPISCQAVTNLVMDTLQSIHSSLPKQFPYVNYLLNAGRSTRFHKGGPKEAARQLINEVKASTPYLKK